MAEQPVPRELFTKTFKMLEKERNKSFMVVKAHQTLMMALYALYEKQDAEQDPEMAQSRVDAFLTEFFDGIGYPDISKLLQLINTNY